jgi:hypothetical protein
MQHKRSSVKSLNGVNNGPVVNNQDLNMLASGRVGLMAVGSALSSQETSNHMSRRNNNN